MCGLFGICNVAIALYDGRKLGALVPTWYLTVRPWIGTLLRLKGRGRLVVMCSRYPIKLALAINLAIGRLIRKCAPTLTKQKPLLLEHRNLTALVFLQLMV